MPINAYKTADITADAIDYGNNADDAYKVVKFTKYLQTPEVLRKGFKWGLLSNAILGAYEGAARSIADTGNGNRDAFYGSMRWKDDGKLVPTLAKDGVRVLGNVGNAMLWDIPDWLGRKISEVSARPSTEYEQQLSKLPGKL